MSEHEERPLHSTRADDVAEKIAGDVRDAATVAQQKIKRDVTQAQQDLDDAAEDASERVRAEAQSVAERLKYEAVMAAAGLQASMGTLAQQMVYLAAEMKRLVRYGRRNRFLIRLLIVSVCFDVLLSCGLAYLFLRTNNTEERAQSQCKVTNEVRSKQVVLWDHVVDLAKASPLPPGQTPEARAKGLTEFQQFVEDTFPQTKCVSHPSGALNLLWEVPLLLAGVGIVGYVINRRRRNAVEGDEQEQDEELGRREDGPGRPG